MCFGLRQTNSGTKTACGQICQFNLNHADFWIGKYEVTFAEYDDFCTSTERRYAYNQGWGRDTRPVINVDWWDARDCCNWWSAREGLPPAYNQAGDLLNAHGNVTGVRHFSASPTVKPQTDTQNPFK